MTTPKRKRGMVTGYPYDHRTKGKETLAAEAKLVACAHAMLARTVLRCPFCDGDVCTMALDHYKLEYQTSCVGVCGMIGPKGATDEIAEAKFRRLMVINTVQGPKNLTRIPAPAVKVRKV